MSTLSRGILILAVLACLPMIAGAATIQAKVIEVESGNTIVVSNINRSLKIKLKAIAPPESGQPFNDSAREHLKELVLDKIVFVEYTNLGEGYISAKVISDGVDVGAQMLRDGCAWYDNASDHALGQSDRDLYVQSEQAARNEKRGLWQNQSPVAPWEFRKAQLDRLKGTVSSPSVQESQPTATEKQSRPSNKALSNSRFGPDLSYEQSELRSISRTTTPGSWTRYESVLGHYSVLFPSDGLEGTYSTFDSAGNPIAFHNLYATSGQALYLLMSGKVPNDKFTDSSAINEMVREFVGGANKSLGRNLITIKPRRDFKLNGYAVRQYSLSANEFSGEVRAYSKQVGDLRELYMLCVMTRLGYESAGQQFLNSFKLSQ